MICSADYSMTPAIQEPQRGFSPARPRSFRYYAAGAVVHVLFAAALAALGYGWSAVPLVAAGVLALLARRAHKRDDRGRPGAFRRPPAPPTVLYTQVHQRDNQNPTNSPPAEPA